MRGEHLWKANNRIVELHSNNDRKAENYKVNLAKAIRFVGITEFRFFELPEKLLKKIEVAFARGYSVNRQGNVVSWINAACEVTDVKIGYICRQYMSLAIPIADNFSAISVEKEIQALCGITQKVGSLSFRQSGGYLWVSGSGRYINSDDSGVARFKELRLYIDTLMEPDAERRKRAWGMIMARRPYRIACKYEGR